MADRSCFSICNPARGAPRLRYNGWWSWGLGSGALGPAEVAFTNQCAKRT
ncbi:MAG: hypothetical protein MI923_22810 [Phycisphaerales bacterium]|nr:hypothetical protein [Phycisphaerales bacterium]